MISGNSTEPQIQAFILHQFPVARKRKLDASTPLLESGVIDSQGVLEVVSFLEQTFGIQIADEELVPENFASIRCMASFVTRKFAPREVSAR
jgi:acyl carrier protein